VIVVAQRVHVVLEDDLDGGEADETVSFALDGVGYEIDLSAKNAAKLRDALSGYVGAARRTTGRKRRSSRGGSNPSDVRAWARANGFTVSDRGRVPSEVVAAYEAAH
jgi:hypothetical protein